MKVIVAHPEQQHSYRLATALKKAGMLEKYFTTVYCKKHSLTNLFSCFLSEDNKTRARNRRCNDLEDEEVVQYCEFLGLCKLLFSKVKWLKPYYEGFRNFTADCFAIRVANYAIRNKIDMVITYDTCSPLLFEKLCKKAPNIIRVMDQSAASVQYLRTIYDKDIAIATSFSSLLKTECANFWSEEFIKRVEREQRCSDFYLSPSTFVDESLLFCGVTSHQILRCPYGVDLNEFCIKEYDDNINQRPLEFVYVGGVKELKGIYYLLQAFKDIPTEEAHLTVVGCCDKNAEYLRPYTGLITFTGLVQHNEVASILRKSDVFIFPSLGDSFSLSALEAAACGLPLILSKNTGVSDYVIDGEEGFVVDIQSAEALKKQIDWFLHNRKQVKIMGVKASQMAMKMTWAEYENKIKTFCDRGI